MKSVTIFWSGVTSKGVHTIGVKYFDKGFACKKFIEVEDSSIYGAGETIDIPLGALN